MKSISILIVEDEWEVLEGMQNMLLQLTGGTCRIFAIGNAEDAAEIVRSHKPQLIITDIVLPHMSGLHLLEQVRALAGYEPKIVVVSSYDEFAYARRSLQLGALDYLLKPFDRDEFCGKIAELIALVSREERHRSDLQHRLEHSKVGAKVLMDQYVLGFCTKRTQLQEHIYHRLQLWGLTWMTTSAYRMAAFSLEGPLPDNDREVELRLFSVDNVVGETIQQFRPSYLLRNMHNVWILISAYPELGETIEAVRDNVRYYQKMELVFGTSGIAQSFQSLAEAYQQSIRALRWATANRRDVFDYGDLPQAEQDVPADDPDDRFVAHLIAGEGKEWQFWLDERVKRTVRHFQLSNRKQIAQDCLDWIIRIQARAGERTGMNMDQIPLSLWENLEKFDNVDALRRELIRYFEQLSEKIRIQTSGFNNAIIEKAKQLIEQNFTRELTLQTLAGELAIHPVWLSHLFKKETGQNFSDYVTELRVGRAKELLRESSLKIYEIAASIGYQDLQHFGKLFKRRTGMTPKEYRYGK